MINPADVTVPPTTSNKLAGFTVPIPTNPPLVDKYALELTRRPTLALALPVVEKFPLDTSTNPNTFSATKAYGELTILCRGLKVSPSTMTCK